MQRFKNLRNVGSRTHTAPGLRCGALSNDGNPATGQFDHDNDGLPDHVDLDDDGDGVLDEFES